jgi:hypothetical protein
MFFLPARKHIDEWDNGLYASGIINEVAINFLIDTGSTVSLISHEVYVNISPIDSDLVHCLRRKYCPKIASGVISQMINW